MLPEGFVFLDETVPGFCWDAKYATADNLTGAPLNGYNVNRVVGSRALAEALAAAAEYFAGLGYRLYGFDAYRPQRGVQSFVDWAKRPEDGRTKAKFYPNLDKSQLFPLGYIAERSGHSRGGSIDLTLAAPDGTPIDMGGDFDLMDDRSHHGFADLNAAQRENRRVLREGMLRFGFKDYENEWWHYNLKSEPYPDTYFDFPIE